MLEIFLKMQNKRRAKGGFTLVELIVVLVILAILAALLIPALTGYIDRAKEKSVIAETRSVVMAAQTLYDEEFASVQLNADAKITFDKKDTTPKPTITFDDVAQLAEVKGTINTIEAKNTRTADDFGKITKVEYTRDGKKCIYENGGYHF
nr:prepilin-type N-terminal cleavage/methylation domain-containing protein [uncultured Agathobaculum sp.]